MKNQRELQEVKTYHRFNMMDELTHLNRQRTIYEGNKKILSKLKSKI